MKILVIYYSRTGNTHKIAREISKSLNCDIEEIHDLKDRKGPIGWFIAGRDGMARNQTQIKKTVHDPSQYDLVIIGTPIWVNMTPAIRTYLNQNADKFKKVAFFCTMGGSGSVKAFAEMGEILDKKPIAILEIRASEIVNNNYQNVFKKFISELKQLS